MASSALSILLGRMAANNMGEKYELPNYGYEPTPADTSSFSEALSELNKLKTNTQPVVAQQDSVQPRPAHSAPPAPQSQGEPNWIRDTLSSVLPYTGSAVGALQGAAHLADQYIPGAKSIAEPVESFFAGANVLSRLQNSADTGISKVFNTPKVFKPYENQEIFTKDGVNANGVAYAVGDLASAVALMATGAGAVQGAASAAKYAPLLQKVSEAVPFVSKLPWIGEIIGGQTVAGAIGTGLGTGAHTALAGVDEVLDGKKSLANFLGRTAFSTVAGTLYGGGANPGVALGKKVIGESGINAVGGAIERLPEFLSGDIPLLPQSMAYTALEQKLKQAVASGDSTSVAQAQGELDATSRIAGMKWIDGIGSVMNSYLGSVGVQGLTGGILPAAVHGMGKLRKTPEIPIAPGAPVAEAQAAATAQSAGTVNAQDDILKNVEMAQAAVQEETLDNTIKEFVSKHAKTRAAREGLGLGATRDEIASSLKEAIAKDPYVEKVIQKSLDDNDPTGAEQVARYANTVRRGVMQEININGVTHKTPYMPEPAADSPTHTAGLSPLKQQAYDILNTEENFQKWSNTRTDDDRPNFDNSIMSIVNGLDGAKSLGTVEDVKDFLRSQKASMNKDVVEQVAPLLHENLRLKMEQSPQTETYTDTALLDKLDALKVEQEAAKAKRAADMAADRDEEVSGKVAQFYLQEANTPEKQAKLGLGTNREEMKANILSAIERDPSVERTLDDAIDSDMPTGALELKQHIDAALSGEEVDRIQFQPELENMNDISRWHYYGIAPEGMDGLSEAEISHALGGTPLHPDADYTPEVKPAQEVKYDPNTRTTYQRAPQLLERDEVGNLLPTEQAKDIPMVIGKPTTIFFNEEKVPGYYVAVPADYNQPTHKNGDQNYANFIENPKDKKGEGGAQHARDIYAAYDPEFAVRTDQTAFEGIPVSSTRLESIQGATRQNLQMMLTPEQYEQTRQLAIKQAKEFGMDSPEQLAVLQSMPNISLHRVIDLPDSELTRIAKIDRPATEFLASASDKSRGRLSLLDPENKFKGNNVQKAFDTLSEIMGSNDNAEETLTKVLSSERLRDRIAKDLTDNPAALRNYIGAIDAKEGRENLIYDLKNLLFGNDLKTLDNLESLPAINQAVEGSLGQLLALNKDPIMQDLKTALMELHTYNREKGDHMPIRDYFKVQDMYGNSLADAYADNPNVENLMRFLTERPPTQRRFKELLVKYQDAREGIPSTIFEPGRAALEAPDALKAAIDDIAARTPAQVKSDIKNIVKNGVASNSPGLLSLSGAYMLPDNDEPLYPGSSMTNRDGRIVLQVLAVAGLMSSPVAMTMMRKLESALPREAAEIAESRIIRPRETSVINIPLTERQLKTVTKQKFGEHKVPFNPDQITPHDAQNLAGKISAAGLTDEAYAYYHAFLDGIFDPDAADAFRLPKQTLAAYGFLPEGFHDDLVNIRGLLDDGKLSQQDYDTLVEKQYADVLEKYRVDADENLRFTEEGNDEMEYWGSMLLLRNAMEGKYPMSPMMQKIAVQALDETQPAYRSIAERMTNRLQDLNNKKAASGDTRYAVDGVSELYKIMNGEEGKFNRIVLEGVEEPSAFGRLMLAVLDIDHTEEPNWRDVISGILHKDFTAFRDEFKVRVERDKDGKRIYNVSLGENLTQAMKEDYRHVTRNMRANDWREGYIERNTVEMGMPVESQDMSPEQAQGFVNEARELGLGDPKTEKKMKDTKYAAQADYAYLLQQTRSTEDIPKITEAIKGSSKLKDSYYKQVTGRAGDTYLSAQMRGEMGAWDAMINKGVDESKWDDLEGLYKTMKPHQREAFAEYMDTHIQHAELNKRLEAIGAEIPPRTNTRPYSGTLSSSLFPLGPQNWKYAQMALKNSGPSLFNAMAGYITASLATDENSRPLGMSRDEFRAFVAASGFMIGLPHLRTYVMSKVHGTTYSAALDTLMRGYNLPAAREMEMTAERKTREAMMEQFEASLAAKNLPQQAFDKQLKDGFAAIRQMDISASPEYAAKYKELESLRADVEKGFSEGIFKKVTGNITGKGFLDKIGHKYTRKLVEAEMKMEEVGRLHNEKITQLDKDFRAKYNEDDINKATRAAIDYDWELSAIAANKKLSEKQKILKIYEKTAELEQKHFGKGGKEAFTDLQAMLSEARRIQIEATSVDQFGLRLDELPGQVEKFGQQIKTLEKASKVQRQAIANTDGGTPEGLSTIKALVKLAEDTDKQRAAIKSSMEKYQYLIDLPERSNLYHHLPRWFDKDGKVKYKVQSLTPKGEKVMHLYKKFDSEGAAEKWMIDFDKRRKTPGDRYYGMPRPERLPSETSPERGAKLSSNLRAKVEDIVRIAYGHGTSNLANLGSSRKEIAEAVQHLPGFMTLKHSEREAVKKQIDTMVSADDLRSVLYSIWEPKIPHLEKRKNVSGYEPVEDMGIFEKGTATAKDYKAVRDFVFGGMNRTVTKSRQDLSKAAIREEMLSQKQFLMDNGMAHSQYFDWLTRNIAEGISGNQYGNLGNKTIKVANAVKTIAGGSKLMFNPVHGMKNVITGTLSTLTEAAMEKGVLRGGATVLSSAGDLARSGIFGSFTSPKMMEAAKRIGSQAGKNTKVDFPKVNQQLAYNKLLDAGVGETQSMNSLLDKEISNKKWQNKMYLISSKTEEFNNKLAALTHAKIALNNGATVDEAVQFALAGRQRTQYSYNPWDSTILERKIKSSPGGIGIVATTLMSSAFRATEHAASIYYRALKNPKAAAPAALAFVLGSSVLSGLTGTPMIGDALKGVEWLEKMANSNPDDTSLTKENSKEHWQRLLGDTAEKLGLPRKHGEQLVRDIYYGLASTSSNVNLASDNTITGMLNPVVLSSFNTLVSAAKAAQGAKTWSEVGMNALKEVTQLNRGFRAGMQLAEGHKLDNKLNRVSDEPFTTKDAAKEFLFGRSLGTTEAIQTNITGGSAINDEYGAQKYISSLYAVRDLKVGSERGPKAGRQLEELIKQAPEIRTNIIKQYEKLRPQRLDDIKKVQEWADQHESLVNWIDRAGGAEVAGNMKRRFGKTLERQVENYYTGLAAQGALGSKVKFRPDKGTPVDVAIKHGLDQGKSLAKKLGKQSEWRELLKSGKL